MMVWFTYLCLAVLLSTFVYCLNGVLQAWLALRIVQDCWRSFDKTGDPFYLYGCQLTLTYRRKK